MKSMLEKPCSLRSILLSTSVMALSVAVPNVAIAQDAEDGEKRLGNVVVTAQKRAESLQEIPIAVTVHQGDDLESDGVDSLAGIGNQTPGLVFSAFSVGQPEISIRGVSTKEDGASANDSVVVSVDDVYIAARTAQVFDIFDLERVEVLRGPQGTLYGKNSIGGSINFVTKKPTEETSIRFRQTIGNYGIFDTAGLISGGLSDNLFGKVSFSRRKHDGFLTNVLQGSPFFGEDQGERENFAIRGQLVYLPTDDLEFVFTADMADDRQGATNREPVGSTGLHGNGNAADPIAVNIALGGAGDPFSTLAETEGFTEREVSGFSLKTTYSGWEFADLISISSYRESEFDWLEDSEGLPPSMTFTDLTVGGATLFTPPTDGFSFDITNSAMEETEQLTQELRLVSKGDGPWSWILGAFYSNEEIDRTERFNFTALGIGPNPDDEQSIQGNETDSYALYGQTEFNLTDRLTFTGGVRYSYEEKDITVAAEILNGNPAAVLLRGAPFGPASASEDFSNVSWKAALDYQVTDDALIYANVSTGFKSGGFTGSASTLGVATTPFDSEEATAYEVGIKSKFADDRILFNALGYFTDYKDLQVTRFFQPIGNSFGEFITENAGEAEISGAEIEAIALLNDYVEVGANYAYLDAEFVDFQGQASLGASQEDFNGNRLRLAPENTFSAYIKADLDLENGAKLSGKAKYRYQDDMFFDPDNNPLAVSPAHEIVDVWVAYTTPNDRIEIKAFVNNATDEEYVTHVFTQRASRIAFGLFGDPRTYGVSATYKFN